MNRDFYEMNPPEDMTYRFVLQAHVRGKSVHYDFRYEFKPDTLLLGWTMTSEDGLKKEPKNITEAKELYSEIFENFYKKIKNPSQKFVVIKKALQPFAWLDIDNTTFTPGMVGATRNKPGFMFIVDNGLVEFGAQKSYYHEFFLQGSRKYHNENIFDGRLIIRALPNIWRQKSAEQGEVSKTGSGGIVHMMFFAKDPKPYAISKRAIVEKWQPSKGTSCITKNLREKISEEFRYWKENNQAKAHKIRDALIEKIREKDIILTYAEIKTAKKHDIENLQGILLVDPHAQFVAEGVKSKVVKTRNFVNMVDEDLVLVSKGKAWGIIKLKKPKVISQEKFKEKIREHLISDAEAEKWWDLSKNPDKELYEYDVEVSSIFKKPVDIRYPGNVQTFLRRGSIELSDSEKKS